MDKNRLAFVTLYTVPEDASGRLECSGVITADDRLIRQNLELMVVDTTRRSNPWDLMNNQRLLYQVSFYDSTTIFDRVEAAAAEFKGTHSRMTNGEYDSGSFRILDLERIKAYLNQLAYPKPART